MAKFILLVLGLFLVYWILKGYRRRVDDAGSPTSGAGTEDMVQCAQCGVHLPRSEGITLQGHFYCCAEHQRAHQAGRAPS